MPPVTRRLTARGRRRRKELIDFAAHRFAANGFHPTSVTEIVDGVGVGKGVFYWYFESKDELFRQILIDAQRDLRRQQRLAIEDEPDPLRRVDAGVRVAVRWLDTNRHLAALLEMARTEERFAPLVRQGEEQAVADALPHIQAGMDAGLIRRTDPVAVAYGILGVTNYLTRALVLQGGTSADKAADMAISLCFEGIMSPEAARARLGRAG